MPIPKRTTVTCPNCRKQFETTVFESLNTDFSPDIVEEVIRGECFHAKGPRCGFVAQLEYDLLYHDLKHNAAVWVLHNTNPEYQKKVAEVRASRLLQYDVTRIVPDIDTLREKAACLESGKDDRVVELCKVFMASQLNRQRPDFAFRNAFYTYHSGKDMIYFYDVNGRKATCSLDSKVYDMIGDWFKKPLLQMEKTPYPIMDYKWALRFYKNLSDQEKVGGTAAGQLDEAAAPGPGDTRMPHDSAKPLPKEEALFCRKCGAKLLPNSRFCSSCGAKAVDKKDMNLCPGPKKPQDFLEENGGLGALKIKKPERWGIFYDFMGRGSYALPILWGPNIHRHGLLLTVRPKSGRDRKACTQP